jgi:predicted alpha/beta-hydrolase family hydrolase
MLCAEQTEAKLVPVPALLLMSYPLHPPRKPAQLRTQHFFNLRTPALFVQGTRDPFGTVEEIEQALKLIPARTKLLTVDSAGHDLGFKGKSRREDLPGTVLAELQSLL